MIRILIADNEVLVRGGLRMILQAQPDLDVVGEASDGNDALDQTRILAPDLVLMDIRMPDLDGIEATQRLLAGPRPTPKVLVLTTFDLDDYVYEAIRAGANGVPAQNNATTPTRRRHSGGDVRRCPARPPDHPPLA
jgi:DNA-binding NarL/FixJ family response regulator